MDNPTWEFNPEARCPGITDGPPPAFWRSPAPEETRGPVLYRGPEGVRLGSTVRKCQGNGRSGKRNSLSAFP
jgi:hypothetical protein